MRSRGTPAASIRSTRAPRTDSAEDSHGSLRSISAMKLYGYQVRSAAAGARSLAAVFRNANAATAHAQAIIARVDAAARTAREHEEEEEEMAVVTAFLTLH